MAGSFVPPNLFPGQAALCTDTGTNVDDRMVVDIVRKSSAQDNFPSNIYVILQDGQENNSGQPFDVCDCKQSPLVITKQQMQDVIMAVEDQFESIGQDQDSDDDLYLSLPSSDTDSISEPRMHVSDTWLDIYRILTCPKLYRQDQCTKGWKIRMGHRIPAPLRGKVMLMLFPSLTNVRTRPITFRKPKTRCFPSPHRFLTSQNPLKECTVFLISSVSKVVEDSVR